MARTSQRLAAVALRSLAPGKHSDGAGLFLLKSDLTTGRWVFRYRMFGRRRDMGLGGWPAVSLSEARRSADAARRAINSDADPIAERQQHRLSQSHLLNDIALDCFEARKGELKSDGAAGRWFSPLELHVLPKLGSTPVTQIRQVAIRDALAKLWREKPVTATKALERLGIVMRHAAAMGLDVDIQATAKARLLLGKPKHVVEHIAALQWQEVPDFYAELTERTPTQLALRLLILTGVRSAPLRHIHLDQVDIDDGLWIVPAHHMKGRVGASLDFRVPLSRQAIEIISTASEHTAKAGLLFPGPGEGVISDMTLSMHMKRRGMEARPHGFRTSLRVWLAEETDAPREIAETVLAHTVGSKVERAYRRTDYLDQRRALMQRWADHVAPRETL